VALFAHLRHIVRREGEHRFGLAIALILGTLARLARRAHLAIDLEINAVLLPLP
jgi:hypothetical protein